MGTRWRMTGEVVVLRDKQPVVLFAPACASFDQFRDFEQRGAAFRQEAAKLVKHASAFEAAPGVFLNGQLAVGENLADAGGVAFGYGALKGYLRDHPEANRKIDGLSQEQRCFLSWAQTWADKAREGWLRQVLAVDPHPTGLYRMTAPSQNEPGFYEAFGIKAGDPMWLDVKDRVKIW